MKILLFYFRKTQSKSSSTKRLSKNAEYKRNVRFEEDGRTTLNRQIADRENHAPPRNMNRVNVLYLKYETLNNIIRHSSSRIDLCEAYYDRGRKYLYNKKYMRALQDFKKAKKLDHDKKLLNFPFKNVTDKITKVEGLLKEHSEDPEYSEDECLYKDDSILSKQTEILEHVEEKPIPKQYFKDILTAVNNIRYEANQAYQSGNVKTALSLYKEACNYLDIMEEEFVEEPTVDNKTEEQEAIDRIDAPCRLRWATILMKRGCYEEALELFPYISPNPIDLNARFQYKYSFCHFNLKNYLEAKNAIERALSETTKMSHNRHLPIFSY